MQGRVKSESTFFFFCLQGIKLCSRKFVNLLVMMLMVIMMVMLIVITIDCESFARRTFTTPKIRTFTTPKFGHFPPPKKNICQEDNCHPHFFSSFFGALFLAFSTYSSWRTSRMGRRRCLMRWSWSTSSRRCVTRWSWSTSSRRCLTSWSWSTSSRGRRWKRSPRW